MAKATAKSKPSALIKNPSPQTLMKAAYGQVCDMESDVTAAGHFADAIAMLAETLDEHDGCVVQQVAWEIRRRVDEIERRRGYLFRFLHPNRAEFEKTGWPTDEVRS